MEYFTGRDTGIGAKALPLPSGSRAPWRALLPVFSFPALMAILLIALALNADLRVQIFSGEPA